MTDLRKAAEMALELLENHVEDPRCEVSICKTIQALRQALAQPEQEPVAKVDYNRNGNIAWLYGPVEPDGTLLYTTPPKREWVGLTDEEIMEASEMRTGCERYGWVERVLRNAEAKLKEKNT